MALQGQLPGAVMYLSIDVRNCEAAVAHLSMWLKAFNKRLADVDEELAGAPARAVPCFCG